MGREAEIESKFWKALRSDRTIMLGLAGAQGGHSQPMTALLDGDADAGPIWIFSARDVELVEALGEGKPVKAQFVARDHEVFASFDGVLTPENDRAVIDRLWNRFVAAWYEGGKDDPQLQLLRLDPSDAQVWLNENSVLAGIKLLLGKDPKKEYADKVADVKLAG